MKKAIGMFVALMVALSMTGVAFACWTETLYISGTVETGELSAEIIAGESFDSEDLVPDKNWSGIYCWVEDDTLCVYVYNAYPSICYHQFFSIHNNGTIPLHINNIDLTYCDLEIDVVISDAAAGHVGGLVLPIQLEPCEYWDGVIVVHVSQDAEEQSYYYFEAEIDITNWNCCD